MSEHYVDISCFMSEFIGLALGNLLVHFAWMPAETTCLGGVVFGDPLLVTPNSDITALVKESSASASGGSKLIFWDWAPSGTMLIMR
jgi:hypothetical protein